MEFDEGLDQERSSVWLEQRSPKPQVAGSNPAAPATHSARCRWTPQYGGPSLIDAGGHPRPITGFCCAGSVRPRAMSR